MTPRPPYYIQENFTLDVSGNPDYFMVQIVTNNTNVASCTDNSLVYSQQSSSCEILTPCVLKKECMAAGFCDYECPCGDHFCALYLVDHTGLLQNEWQLCDILV